jgi:hypothetical protein
MSGVGDSVKTVESRTKVDFRDAEEVAAIRNAVEYDAIIVVGDHPELYERYLTYRELGVDVYIYPLRPRDSPTIYSLLGIIGLLLELSDSGKRVLVEGYGGQYLLEAAFSLALGCANVLPTSFPVEKLQSPLHLRSIIVLHSLKDGGVDIKLEALKNVDHAFTGGDAHKSDIIEHIVDISLSLKMLGRENALHYCPAEAYRSFSRGKSVEGLCGEAVKSLEKLDENNTGAAKVVGVIYADGTYKLLVGCKLLSENDCIEELGNGISSITRLLAERFGVTVERFEILDPEEVACIIYGEVFGYECW